MRAVVTQEQYMEHFEGYLKPIEDDSALFRDTTEQLPSTHTIAPKLLWYLGPHPKLEGEPVSAHQGSGPKQAVQTVSN